MDGGERGGKRVYGTPVLCSQEGETDLAGREADVVQREHLEQRKRQIQKEKRRALKS